MRSPSGFIRPGYDPLKVPNAPTIGTASVASDTSVSVTFAAPTNVGGSAITAYYVTATDSLSGTQFTATGSSSPISITGLTTGNTYTAQVFALNSFGPSVFSAVSNSIAPVAQGQQAYTTPGTYSWVAPAEVTAVSVVAVGCGGRPSSGGSGGGGELRYKNNITVTPGNAYTVVVGAATATGGAPAGSSSFNSTSCVANGGINATSGSQGGAGGSGGIGDGGGNGGNGAAASSSYGSGGGAGGYAGAGGNGSGTGSPTLGTGGAGAGGISNTPSYLNGGGGGGVGILGQGANASTAGAGGSGGTAGNNSNGLGGSYGGGGGSYAAGGAGPGTGAVRIIWPGATRQFPSTNTGDV